MSREEKKTLIFVVLISVIAFGFLIWLFPNTPMYQQAREIARFNDYQRAAIYASPLRDSNISISEYDKWFAKFEKKWGVSREAFEASVIINKAVDYFDEN